LSQKDGNEQKYQVDKTDETGVENNNKPQEKLSDFGEMKI
jgi:hypothetical protein